MTEMQAYMATYMMPASSLRLIKFFLGLGRGSGSHWSTHVLDPDADSQAVHETANYGSNDIPLFESLFEQLFHYFK